MPKVLSPNKQYTGFSASVHFVNGVGESSDPHLLEWFKDHGYEIEEVEGNKPVEDMTIPELKEFAKLHNIDLGDATRKEDIFAKIKGGDLNAVPGQA